MRWSSPDPSTTRSAVNTLPQVYQAATEHVAEPHERAAGPGPVPDDVPRAEREGLQCRARPRPPAISTPPAPARGPLWRIGRSADRDYGSAVMYADGKILVVGGGDPPTNTAEVIDLNQPTPTWRSVAPMSVARRQLNATLLPDGTVLVTGGTSGPGFNNPDDPVYPAELWDPATESWTTLASATRHAAPLPLRRRPVAGRTRAQHGRKRLTDARGLLAAVPVQGPRPTLSGVPSTIGYGQTFRCRRPEAASITKVTLIRITSVTHAFNENQRLSVLSFTPGPRARWTSWRRRTPTSRRRDTTCSSSSTATAFHPSGRIVQLAAAPLRRRDADLVLAEQRGRRRRGLHPHGERQRLRVRCGGPLEWRAPDDHLRQRTRLTARIPPATSPRRAPRRSPCKTTPQADQSPPRSELYDQPRPPLIADVDAPPLAAAALSAGGPAFTLTGTEAIS